MNVIDLKSYKFDTARMSTNHLSSQYVAGFFDGEGCISIFFANYNYLTRKIGAVKGCTQLAITIANVDLRILELIAVQYGGVIHKHKLCGSGRRRQAYVWRLSGVDRQKRFLTEINEYAIVKKEAIVNALRYLSTVKYSGYRPSLEEREIRYSCWKQSAVMNKRANGARKNIMVA